MNSRLLLSNLQSYLLIVLMLIVGCAEVAPPPGGEVDKTGPVIINTEPLNGATDVPLDQKVIIYFSEWIIMPEAKQSVFISPYQIVEPKIKWKSDRVEILFVDSLETNQTYNISLSSDLKDLRNNRIDKNLSIAFSTGSTIDSGVVSGHLFLNDKPQINFLAALYDLNNFSDSDIYDSLVPLYITQVNKDGYFEFSYIKPKKYRLIAFDDKNTDNFFNPYHEKFAVTDRAVDLTIKNSIDSLYMSVTSQDTLPPIILEAIINKNNLLQVKLSKEIETSTFINNMADVRVISLSNPDIIQIPNYFIESIESKTSRFTFIFDILPEDNYQLNLTPQSGLESLVVDSLPVKYKDDKIKPLIYKFYPDALPRFISDTLIYMVFSEPVDANKITSNTFSLWKDSVTIIPLTTIWINECRVNVSSKNISSGSSYKFKLLEFELMDKTGNKLGDSLMEFIINFVNDDSLGSISGTVTNKFKPEENLPVVLYLKNYSTAQEYKKTARTSSFNINVPSGNYQLSGYLDLNNNGIRDLGRAKPFEFAEPFAIYPDTVKVRSRFETAEINFIIR